MKNLKWIVFLLFVLGIISTSCDNKKDSNEGTPPELPPYESLAFDFDAFTGSNSDTIDDITTKSATSSTYLNFTYSVLNVSVWNAILTGVLAVPVASFSAAMSEQPVYLGNASWQWSYSLNIGINTYTARLVGKVMSEDINGRCILQKQALFPLKIFSGLRVLPHLMV